MRYLTLYFWVFLSKESSFESISSLEPAINVPTKSGENRTLKKKKKKTKNSNFSVCLYWNVTHLTTLYLLWVNYLVFLLFQAVLHRFSTVIFELFWKLLEVRKLKNFKKYNFYRQITISRNHSSNVQNWPWLTNDVSKTLFLSFAI